MPRDTRLFLSVYVDDIKLALKKQSLDPMWKTLNKEVDLEKPTSFLDQVCLGCTQSQCETSMDIVENYRTMFESIISARKTEKNYQALIYRRFRRCPTIWKVMPKSVWYDIVN